MKILHLMFLALLMVAVSAPAHAASWGRLEKGKCDAQTGKRAYKAKLKRNLTEKGGAELCSRLRRTINKESRVPDMCKKSGMASYTGYWLVTDASCLKAKE
jgi:hypothetical protein